MSLIYDLLFLLIILIFLFRGRSRGFISTAIGLVGWLAALIICLKVAEPVSVWIYDHLVEARVISLVESKIPTDLINGISGGFMNGQQILGNVQEFMSEQGGILGSVFGSVDLPASTSEPVAAQGSAELAAFVTTTYLKPVLLKVLNLAVSVAVFLLTLLVFRLLRSLFRIRKKPTGIAGKANRILGAILGFAIGCICAYLYTMLLSLSIRLTGGELRWLSNDALLATYIVKLFI